LPDKIKNSNHKENNNLGNGFREDNKDNKSKDKDRPIAKLLIVDDDQDIVYVLKHGLAKNKFLVDAFTNAEEALQKFQSTTKDYWLVLSDIRMPGMSGIRLARKVKEINPNVKVILMTAIEINDNEFSKVFPSTQVDGFIQKPVAIGDLTNKIFSLIGEGKRLIE
jgi:CheY-like chemotaxis protein